MKKRVKQEKLNIEYSLLLFYQKNLALLLREIQSY